MCLIFLGMMVVLQNYMISVSDGWIDVSIQFTQVLNKITTGNLIYIHANFRPYIR